MAEPLEGRSNHWSLFQPRRAPRQTLSPRILRRREPQEERNAGTVMGPYETRYEVAHGYSTGREVLRP